MAMAGIEMQRTTTHQILFFVTLLATALAMGAALAHALELPKKIGLSADEYFIVQKIYRGWNKLAYLLGVEFFGMVLLLYLNWSCAGVRKLLLLAMVCLAAAQAAFWLYTYPANRLTADWTLRPENWEALRDQWEYSHLAGAVFQTLALAFIASALASAGAETNDQKPALDLD